MSSSGGPVSGIPTQRAITPVAGFALQNGTPTILTWTAPNDGQLHNVTVPASLAVTVNETGGAVQVQFTVNGTLTSWQLFNGGAVIGTYVADTFRGVTVDPNTTVTVFQNGALTVGTAKVFAAIYAD